VLQTNVRCAYSVLVQEQKYNTNVLAHTEECPEIIGKPCSRPKQAYMVFFFYHTTTFEPARRCAEAPGIVVFTTQLQ
jgi:hypothetical protein